MNISPAEAAELKALEARQKVLFEHWKSQLTTDAEQQEWIVTERRIVEIVHDLNVARTARNQGLRDRVWKDLTPRALRFRELQAKKELDSSETAELETLRVWFRELQAECCKDA